MGVVRNIAAQNLVRKIVHWLLIIITVLYLITGLGITEFRIIESLTFGLLTKNMAFRIHDSLLIPFVILLIMHILGRVLLRRLIASSR